MTAYPGGAGGHGIYSNMQSVPGLNPDYDINLHGHQHGYDFQGDLDLFTNTQFFDFDMGEMPETQSPTSEETAHWPVHNNNNNIPPNSATASMGTVDYLNGGKCFFRLASQCNSVYAQFPYTDSSLSHKVTCNQCTIISQT